MSDYTTKLHPLSLESLKHLNEGRLERQFREALDELNSVVDNLDDYQSKNGTAPFKITITLSGKASSDELDLESNVTVKLPCRKALRSSARRHGAGYSVTEECLQQTELPGLRPVRKESAQ